MNGETDASRKFFILFFNCVSHKTFIVNILQTCQSWSVNVGGLAGNALLKS